MKRETFTRRKTDPAKGKSAEGANLSSSGSLLSFSSTSGISPCTGQDADKAQTAPPREQLGTLLLEWLESLGFKIPASLSGSLYGPGDDLHFSGKRLRDIEQRLSKFKKKRSQTGNKPSGEIYIDNTDLMNLLHISPRTSRHWRTLGRINYSRVGKKLFFRLADVEAMLERYKVGGRRPP